MPPAAFSLLLEVVELGEQQSGVHDRIDADVIAAAVGGAAGESDVDPRKSAMSRTDRESCRLGDDRCFGAYARCKEGAEAKAFVLLVDDGGDDDLRLRIFADDRC